MALCSVSHWFLAFLVWWWPTNPNVLGIKIASSRLAAGRKRTALLAISWGHQWHSDVTSGATGSDVSLLLAMFKIWWFKNRILTKMLQHRWRWADNTKGFARSDISTHWLIPPISPPFFSYPSTGTGRTHWKWAISFSKQANGNSIWWNDSL